MSLSEKQEKIMERLNGTALFGLRPYLVKLIEMNHLDEIDTGVLVDKVEQSAAELVLPRLPNLVEGVLTESFVELHTKFEIWIGATDPRADDFLGFGQESQKLEKLGIQAPGNPKNRTRVGIYQLQRNMSALQAFERITKGNLGSAVFEGEQVKKFIKDWTRLFWPASSLLFLLRGNGYCVVGGRDTHAAGVSSSIDLEADNLNEFKELKSRGFSLVIPRPN